MIGKYITVMDGTVRLQPNGHQGFNIESTDNDAAMKIFSMDLPQVLFDRIVELESAMESLTINPVTIKNNDMLPADAQVDFDENGHSFQLSDNKYEIGKDQDGNLAALRYGEPWRSFVGDHLVHAMYDLLCDYEDAAIDVRRLACDIDKALNGADDSAVQPSLCDIASQLESLVRKADGVPILKRLQFNSLTAAQAERLFLLLEERAESIQAVGKILRHGYESHHPFIEGAGTNRQALQKEEGDGCAAMDMMCNAGDMDINAITEAAHGKHKSAKQWLHHQETPNDKA